MKGLLCNVEELIQSSSVSSCLLLEQSSSSPYLRDPANILVIFAEFLKERGLIIRQ